MTFLKRFSIIFVVTTSLGFYSPFSDAVAPEEFAKSAIYQQVKLSPDGNKLAVAILTDGIRKLVVLNLADFSSVGGLAMDEGFQVGDFFWANNERLVFAIMQKVDYKSELEYRGELFAVNFDGSDPKNIFGYRAGSGSASGRLRSSESVYGWANIISSLPNDKDHILISSSAMRQGQGGRPTVHKLNIYNGRLSKKLSIAPESYPTFIADRDGNLKLVTGINTSSETRVFNYADDGWSEISSKFGENFSPVAISEDAKSLIFMDNFQQDKQGVFKLDLATGERTAIYTDKVVDVSGVNVTVNGTSAYAVRTDDGFPAYSIIDQNTPESVLFKSLLAALPGYKLNISSQSEDGQLWVIYASSDIDAGTYYLFDKQTNQLTQLLANMQHLDLDSLSPSKPISFTADDGKKVHGYITYPKHIDNNTKTPLVTLVHGGPHGVRDYWAFDPDVQMLAAQGYAVLRVNFRGSGGYGSDFLNAGYLQWGDKIQQDIIQGTRHVISQGRIDENNVCIMGASFGGYSAAMSAALAPDLFKCAVAHVGVFDLEIMRTEGDITEVLFGDSYLDKAIGSDTMQLRDYSPVNHVSKLSGPILIAHGKQDRRVPFAHAEALKEALEKHNKEFEWFVKDSEGHGFFDEKNRAEYYKRVAAFLAENLKE